VDSSPGSDAARRNGSFTVGWSVEITAVAWLSMAVIRIYLLRCALTNDHAPCLKAETAHPPRYLICTAWTQTIWLRSLGVLLANTKASTIIICNMAVAVASRLLKLTNNLPSCFD